ncbi:MAG TPA: 4Fe-4S dicluster domain-containing protein [Acidobacteriota bacterium]|nr:4Fe-4S dicluster domain-containing protein [Acidobacteriota bacterium]
MFILPKSQARALVDALAADYDLYGPVLDGVSGEPLFGRADDPGAIRLDAAIPYNPPKAVVFPQAERIMSYHYDRGARQASIFLDDFVRPKALVGIRACDLTGLLCLDRFYLGQEYVDEVYRDHRKKMFVVANTCVRPFPQCFCVCTDSGPAAREGYDVALTAVGDAYLFETGSEKGEAVARALGLKDAGPGAAALKAKTVDASIARFDAEATENKAWISRVMNRITMGFIGNDVWEYIGDQCFECGACSFVCPTCSCFNIEDLARGEGRTDRMRSWDSCSYEGYTRMAGDHNPRHPVEDRRNKRFFCKLSFSQSKKYLRPGCVGCGRCNRVCPGDIGIANVVTYIRREITKAGAK